MYKQKGRATSSSNISYGPSQVATEFKSTLSLIEVAVKKEMLCVFNTTTLAHRWVRDILHKEV